MNVTIRKQRIKQTDIVDYISMMHYVNTHKLIIQVKGDGEEGVSARTINQNLSQSYFFRLGHICPERFLMHRKLEKSTTTNNSSMLSQIFIHPRVVKMIRIKKE